MSDSEVETVWYIAAALLQSVRQSLHPDLMESKGENHPAKGMEWDAIGGMAPTAFPEFRNAYTDTREQDTHVDRRILRNG